MTSARATQPGFIEGALVAAALSLAAGALAVLLTVLTGAAVALTLTITAVALAYLLYLLARSPRRAGRITTLLGWSAITTLVLIAAPGWTLPAQVLLIWLARSLHYQPGVLAAAGDLTLGLLGIGAALWAVAATGSLAAAVWSCLLVQALFPSAALLARRRGQPARTPEDRFASAERTAARLLEGLRNDSIAFGRDGR